MSTSFPIQTLVDRFTSQWEIYEQQCNEVQTRNDFINPFFIALGWDVNNEQNLTETYRPVVLEDTLKIGRATKMLDYSFRVRGIRKFFVEAKNPAVNLKTDPEPAFQVRRYGWNAKLSISIVTNFAEFAVYDCRFKPAKTDKASTARLWYLCYTDYLKEWEKLVEYFSFDAVWHGSLENYLTQQATPKGILTVDAARKGVKCNCFGNSLHSFPKQLYVESCSSMKLKTVHIENFRGIKELELTIHPQLTVLIGQNGDGKTTVLDAIAIGLEKLITRLTGERGQPFPNNSIYQTLDPDGKPKQEAYTKITLENEEGLRWDKIKKRQFPRATEPMLASKGDKDLKLFTDHLINAIQAGAEAVNLPVVVYYRTNRAVLDSAQTTPIHSEPSLAMAIENRFAAFRGALAKDISTRFHHAFAWFVNQENEEARLIKAKADLNFKLPVLEAVRYAIEQMLPGCTRPRSTLHPPRFLVDYQDPQTGKTEELSLNQISDGYRTVLALVMDLAQRMAQANPHLGEMVIQTAPAIVLIDEVDLHLHPIWQQRVLLDLMNTFPKVQFIVTTHSPQVITTVKAENLRILARDSNRGILAYPPLISPYASESGLALESVMHVASRPSRLLEVSQLDEYLALVNRGEYDTPTAKDLREKLEKTLPNDPALEVADMVIRKYQVLKKTGLKR